MFGNFIVKKCVVFNLTSLGALKNDCVIKTIDMINFLPLMFFNKGALKNFAIFWIKRDSNTGFFP